LLALLAILIPGLLGTVYESVFNFYNLNAYYDGQLPNLLSVLAMFSLAIALFITGRLFKGWTTSSDIVRKMYVFIAVLNLLFVISTSFESMVARYVDFHLLITGMKDCLRYWSADDSGCLFVFYKNKAG
jgi:predicted ferric reductase